MDYKKRLYDLRTDNDLKQTDIAAVLKITGQAGLTHQHQVCRLPQRYPLGVAMAGLGDPIL